MSPPATRLGGGDCGGSLAQRVQYSVFECEIDPAQWAMLRTRLKEEINAEVDSLRFYRLGANWRSRIEHIGAKPSYDPAGPLLVSYCANPKRS